MRCPRNWPPPICKRRSCSASPYSAPPSTCAITSATCSGGRWRGRSTSCGSRRSPASSGPGTSPGCTGTRSSPGGRRWRSSGRRWSSSASRAGGTVLSRGALPAHLVVHRHLPAGPFRLGGAAGGALPVVRHAGHRLGLLPAFRPGGRHRRGGLLAGAFLLWGIHHLDYLILRAQGAWNPWGYYLDIFFELAVGTGVLLLVLDDLRRGLSALGALSGDLQRAGREDQDVLAALLERPLALPGVSGTALYMRSDDGARCVRGAGVCAEWPPTPPPSWRPASRRRWPPVGRRWGRSRSGAGATISSRRSCRSFAARKRRGRWC